MRGHPFIKEVLQAVNKPPNVILYTDEQMIDLSNVCRHQKTIIGIDRTFNLGACYVTLFVYKNLNIIRKCSGDHQIQLGPLYLHWDGDYATYQRFFSHIQCKINEIPSPIEIGSQHLTIGSDDEKAMTKAMQVCFPNSTMLLCIRHLKENTRRYLQRKIGLNDKATGKIIQDIFGNNGLLNTKDAHSFEAAAVCLDTEYLGQVPKFSKYFANKLLPQLRDKVHRPRLEKQWIPLKWTNNNCESMNHIIKLSANWKASKLPDLVDKLHAIVKLQISDLRRAIHQQGNYELAPSASFLRVSHNVWSTKSKIEKDRLFSRLLTHHVKPVKAITSSDGKLTIPKTPTTAKKPGQRKRSRSVRTTTSKRSKRNKQ